MGWGPAKEPASQCARICQNQPLANYQSGNDKRPGSRGFKKLSEFGNSFLQGYEAPKMLVLLCLGAIREGRVIRDRPLLTS